MRYCETKTEGKDIDFFFSSLVKHTWLPQLYHPQQENKAPTLIIGHDTTPFPFGYH